MSILCNFESQALKQSFLNSLPAFSSQLSHKALPLNCFEVAVH